MKKVAFWIVPLIAIGVAFFIVIFLIDINPKVPKEAIENRSNIADDESSAKNSVSWLEKITTDSKKGTQYPINELYINIDLEGSPTQTRYYLVTNVYDESEMRNIKHLLDESLAAFVSERVDENSSLVKIESTNLAQLKMVEAKLKHYNISTKLIIEEK